MSSEDAWNRGIVRLRALGKLNAAWDLAERGQFFDAFDALGLSNDDVDDLTLEQAKEVFIAKAADLWTIVKGAK